MQSYKGQNTILYNLLEKSKSTTKGYNLKDQTQGLGKVINKANA